MIIVKFCPKCGVPLIEQKRNGKMKLVCPICGYEEKEEKNSSDYGLVPQSLASEIERVEGFEKISEDKLKVGGHLSE